MTDSTHPFFVIYIVWHPKFADGERIAKVLYDHYRRDLYTNVTGGFGFSVIYRFANEPGRNMPIDIDFDEAETSAVILLIDDEFATDSVWTAWIHDLVDRADACGLCSRVFPVAMSPEATKICLSEQALRWDQWIAASQRERENRLIAGLSYQFCRMLRLFLSSREHNIEDEEALEQYLRKIDVFLSHSKHDAYGERIAKLIREFIHDSEGLSSFFDVYDIPAGLRFNKVILQKVKMSSVVAIYTDSYSSREWCRREIIEAKKWNVPLVVANCIRDFDDRSFPYMGNVPVVRMEPEASDRIEYVVGRLLDEVLKDFLWKCRIKLAADLNTKNVVFLPRPPELISLVSLKADDRETTILVYPDPPIGAEEARLFEIISPSIRLQSMIEWLAEPGI
jgi:hypothetical protein